MSMVAERMSMTVDRMGMAWPIMCMVSRLAPGRNLAAGERMDMSPVAACRGGSTGEGVVMSSVAARRGGSTGEGVRMGPGRRSCHLIARKRVRM